MSTLGRKIGAITAGVVLAAGAASSAFAAGIFTVDPNSIPGVTAGADFSADFVQGGSSTRVTQIGVTNDYTSNGWIQFTGFMLGGSTVGAGTTRLTVDYGLYATFTQTFACPSPISVGVTCDVSTVSLSVFADPGFADAFTNATLASDPTVTDTGSNDVLLATANVVTSGTAGINSLGGAFENVNTDFVLTAAGSNYFIKPVPFFNLAFSEFNNTSLGIACNPANCTNASVVAITGESGGSQFVPEPATLALAGIALIAAGFARRRRS